MIINYHYLPPISSPFLLTVPLIFLKILISWIYATISPYLLLAFARYQQPCVPQHILCQPFQHLCVCFHTWTHVYFYYPWVVVLINHEVKPHQLTKPFFWCDIPLTTFYAPDNDIFYFFQNLIPFLLTNFLYKPSHFPYTLFDWLLFVLLLNMVVSQMNESVLDIVQRIVIHTKSQIALIIKVDFWRIVVLNVHPLPDIKFSTFKKHWLFYVLLDHKLYIPTKAVVSNIIEVVETANSPPSRQNLV